MCTCIFVCTFDWMFTKMLCVFLPAARMNVIKEIMPTLEVFRLHTQSNVSVRMCMCACVCAYVRAYVHVCVRMCMCACVCACVRATVCLTKRFVNRVC